MQGKKLASALLAGSVAVGMMLAASPDASARSLWAVETEAGYVLNGSIFADRKARNIGDILSIVISERTTTTTNKSTTNEKEANVSINAGTGIFDFIKAVSGGGTDSFEATGAASATNRVAGNITVTVVDVMPNGNLIVEGTQSIWQNRDEHKITLRGIVRRDDVTAANTVPSTRVADATLRFDGKGPLNAKQRQGILTQIFNILF